MCYNEVISLNTFVFSISVMAFIYYNNQYTQYKIKDFQNKYVYLFFISIVSMQLVEYFLWKSIKTGNVRMNEIASTFGWIIIRILQPVSFISFLDNTSLRNLLVVSYLICLFVFTMFIRTSPIHFFTSVKDGHLFWNWLYGEKIEYLIYGLAYFGFLIPVFIKLPWLMGIALVYMIYLYFYRNNNWTSMWCWSINLTFIYYLVWILVVLPYHEYNGLC
jgi:hypothetical protein